MKFFMGVFLFFALCVQAKHLHTEKFYQMQYAKTITGARTEVVAPDGTRCDILTVTHAIEVDFASKWSEAIGQSLNYALQFNRRAGILLIIEDAKDYKYFVRVNSIVKHFNMPIDVYTIKPTDVAIEEKESTDCEFWVSTTGKRHNSSCRYYKTSKGSIGTKNSGVPCKICGG
jgi:hypothetical protein